MPWTFFFLFSVQICIAADFPPHLLAGCTIFDEAGKKMRVLPGSECILMEDGSFISMADQSIRKFQKDGSLSWEIKGERFHHQLNLSEDQKEILALGSRYIKDHTGEVRVDEFIVARLDGTLVAKTSAEILFKPFVEIPKPPFGGKRETSHFNSFHPIPEKWKNLYQGDYLLNSLGIGIFVVNRTLTEVRQFIPIPDARSHLVHDVQVGRDGHLLMFINELAVPGARTSAIYSFNMKAAKGKILFSGQPHGLFYSSLAGGVQEWGENLLIVSDVHNGTYFIDRKKKEILKYFQETHWEGFTFRYVQQVRGINPEKFLSHHSPPRLPLLRAKD